MTFHSLRLLLGGIGERQLGALVPPATEDFLIQSPRLRLLFETARPSGQGTPDPPMTPPEFLATVALGGNAFPRKLLLGGSCGLLPKRDVVLPHARVQIVGELVSNRHLLYEGVGKRIPGRSESAS